jgi:hypothetical protein
MGTSREDAIYTSERILRIREEIQRQWENHLVTRAAFPVDAARSGSKYRSRGFYRHHGADLSIEINEPQSPLIRRALKDLPHWLNQNFIIRLFGVLDESNVITAGKETKNPFTEIVAELRHLVGSHTSGYPNPEGKKFRKVTALIKSSLDCDIDLGSVRDFHLDIKKVLRPLKDECINFVRTLEGKPIPKKKANCEK